MSPELGELSAVLTVEYVTPGGTETVTLMMAGPANPPGGVVNSPMMVSVPFTSAAI